MCKILKDEVTPKESLSHPDGLVRQMTQAAAVVSRSCCYIPSQAKYGLRDTCGRGEACVLGNVAMATAFVFC